MSNLETIEFTLELMNTLGNTRDEGYPDDKEGVCTNCGKYDGTEICIKCGNLIDFDFSNSSGEARAICRTPECTLLTISIMKNKK